MKWAKKGPIFELPGTAGWMRTHAAIPFAERRGDDLFRVYFCSRDSRNRAQIGYFEIGITNPKKILRLSERPVIGLGPLGSFDDSGVTSSWVVHHNGKSYQYYTGWSLGITVPFYFYIGLAISEDGGERFYKVSEAPVLGRNKIDPYLTASPCVLVESDIWKMWYVSATNWSLENGKPKHYYHIKYAESADGIHWSREGKVCIDYKGKDEYAIARPCVIREKDTYKMWYSYRGESYRIGYAESTDGIHWERKDEEVGLGVSESGWDSEMVAYAFIFDHKGQRYMLYNGNGYGKTGIGLAVLADKGIF
jgi:hypothetical protein